MVIGAACTAVLSPLAVIALVGVGDMSGTAFVVDKAVLGVTLGAVVTPLIAVRARIYLAPSA